MHSTHTAELPIAHLPPAAKLVHLFPALGNTSLVSLGLLCDADCTATFTKNTVCISYNGTTLLRGTRSKATHMLWHLQLPPATPRVTPTPLDSPQHHANLAVNHNASPAELVKFAHASLFSPAISTLQSALRHDYIPHFPGLTLPLLNKHPPQSVATIKGHLDKARQGRQSTTSALPIKLESPFLSEDHNMDDPDQDFFPTAPTDGARTHYVYAAIADHTGKIFTDQTGRFVVPSSTGNNYVLILYDFDSNYIHAEPIKSRTTKAILDAYAKAHNLLVKAGLKPKLQRLDNECSDALKRYMEANDIAFQFVPPGDHRRNAAERAIRTFKNHFIAGLCSTDKDFPLHLWDRLLGQALLTLNLLRGSRINPKHSAWSQLHGPYNFNSTPIAPPGIHVLVHEEADKRRTWAPHAYDAWYVGPALNHYRCYRTWMWGSQKERTPQTVTWLTDKYTLPLASSTELVLAAANDIVKALQHPSSNSPLAPLADSEHELLQNLATILTNRTTPTPPLRVPAEPKPAPITSATTTKPTTDPELRVPPVTTTSYTALPRRSQRKKTTAAPRNKPQSAPRPSRQKRNRNKHIATSTTLEATTAYLTTELHRDIGPLHTAQRTAYKAVHPDTGESVEYKLLLSSSEGSSWEHSCAEELGRLAQGCPGVIDKGTETIFFIPHTSVPKGRKATYLRLVVADRPQKENPRRVRMTCGGDKVDYPGDVSTKTSSLPTVKLHLNSTISTPNARYMTMDIKDFYLNTPMDHYEYMKIPVSCIPKVIFEHYKLAGLVHNGFVYVEIRKGMYGLPQSGRIANDVLVPYLSEHGYLQAEHTPGLFVHSSRPLSFTLVVDDFGVKYVGKEHAHHLYNILAKKYTMSSDWTGNLYCGITLKWDYTNNTVDLSMPGYVEAALQRFQHPPILRRQHSPAPWSAPVYGATTQYAPTTDTTEPLDAAGIRRLQEIIGVFLYYGRAIDHTMLVALGSLASAQSKGTKATADNAVWLLNYAATHPSATLRYTASQMILFIHSDASYLSVPKARSRAGGFFYLGNKDDPTSHIPPNGAAHVLSNIMRNVMASATEAEIGAAFHNAQDGCMLRTTLAEMGHTQPPTIITTDNSVAEGIINDKVKQKRSKAIDMRFYWLRDRVRQGQFVIHWQPGKDNLADYFTKHFPPSHHQQMRPLYLHEAPPPTVPTATTT